MPSYLLETTFYVALLAAAVRMAAPLIFAAIGETMCEHAGVINVGLEGTMLIGAWSAFMGMYYSGSVLVGVGAAMLGGMIITAVLGYVIISRGANQIISGIVVTIFAVGFTSLMYRHIFRGTPPSIDSFTPYPIPFLSDLPVVGQILFQHTILSLSAFLIVPLASFVIYRTQFGLCLRAAGELPAAVDTAGVNVQAIQYASILDLRSTRGAWRRRSVDRPTQSVHGQSDRRAGIHCARHCPAGALGAVQGLAWNAVFRHR